MEPNVRPFTSARTPVPPKAPQAPGKGGGMREDLSIPAQRDTALPPPPAGVALQPVAGVMATYQEAEREASAAVTREREVAGMCMEQLIWHLKAHDPSVLGVKAQGSETEPGQVEIFVLRQLGGTRAFEEEHEGIRGLASSLQRLGRPLVRGTADQAWECVIADPSAAAAGQGWSSNWEASVAHSRAATEHLEARDLHPEGSPRWLHHQSEADRHSRLAETSRAAANESLGRGSRRDQLVRSGAWNVRVEPLYPNNRYFGDPKGPHSPALGREVEIRPVAGVGSLDVNRDKALLENLPSLKDVLSGVLLHGRGRFGDTPWLEAEELSDLLNERDTTEQPWRVEIKPLIEFDEMVGWRVAIYLRDGEWGDAGGDYLLIKKAPELLGVLKSLYQWAVEREDLSETIWGECLGVIRNADPSFKPGQPARTRRA